VDLVSAARRSSVRLEAAIHHFLHRMSSQFPLHDEDWRGRRTALDFDGRLMIVAG
jgi:hypothetical protein